MQIFYKTSFHFIFWLFLNVRAIFLITLTVQSLELRFLVNIVFSYSFLFSSMGPCIRTSSA